MTPQDYEDINILKHAARDILREARKLLSERSFDELDCEELVEKGGYLKRVAELISEIRDNGKHLPYGEEQE
jgi:hypothetical protein